MSRNLPKAEQAEESVIGCVLIDSECVDVCLSILHHNNFGNAEYSKIWKAIEDLHKKGSAIDIVTLNDELGEGYATTLTDIVQRTPHSANVESYVRMIDEASMNRTIIATAAKIAEIGYQGMNADEALNAAEAAVMRLRSARSTNTFDSMTQLVDTTLAAKRKGGIKIGRAHV